MKPQQQRALSKESPKTSRKAAKSKRSAPESELEKLYSRLNQTHPGSKESKRIADEIIDSIG